MSSNPQMHEYAELKGLLAQQGVFEKQPLYYTGQVLQILSCLGLALGILLTTQLFWLQLLNAAFLAFVFTQIAFIGHDASHRQICKSPRWTAAFGLVCTLLTAISYSWWAEKHTQHHRHPNDLERDPDVRLRFLAFSEKQTSVLQGWRRAIIKRQARLFVPMLLLQGFAIRVHSVRFLWCTRSRGLVTESLCMVVHFTLYLGVVCSSLGMWEGMAFMLVHQMLFGLYMGSVFAPNHKGMLVLQGNSALDRLRQQVLTARNVRAHPLTDFWFGGLNYQIEHHLFPHIARNKLKKAQTTVRAFCQARSISYRETTLVQAYRETLRSLHHVGEPLRHVAERRGLGRAQRGTSDEARRDVRGREHSSTSSHG
jgi:fatty acid desaturase